VGSIDRLAFAGSDISSIGIAADNRHFRVSGDFLLNRDGTLLIGYFGRDPDVTISKKVQELGVGSFASCKWIQELRFRPSSDLRCIGARAFEKCRMLSWIFIPQSMELLCHSCFRECTALVEVHFEAGSKLRGLEAGSFRACPPVLSVSLPDSLRESHAIALLDAAEINIKSMANCSWSGLATHRRSRVSTSGSASNRCLDHCSLT
jgi:hypothetical protein